MRRIDMSLGKLEDKINALPEFERNQIINTRDFSVIQLLSRVRSMEISEEDIQGTAGSTVADMYDRLISPGDPLVDSLLRVGIYAMSGTDPVEQSERQGGA